MNLEAFISCLFSSYFQYRVEESDSSGRTHPHVVNGGIKCERGLKEHSYLS